MTQGETNLFNGVVLVTGEHGTGKTSFALEASDPARMHFIDDDLKGRGTIDQLKRDGIEFGMYTDYAMMTQNLKRLQAHMVGRKIIEDIPGGVFDGLVWDTWTGFAETCHSYVLTHPDEFREKDGWAAMGKIRAGEEYKEARGYEAALIGMLQNKAPLVILVSHLKNQYINNAPTGKEIPAVSRVVDRVCTLRLWLRHNPASTTPIALVLKNFDKKVYDPQLRRLRTVQVLPAKITPLEGERSLWDSIARYMRDPIGSRQPSPDEVPDDFERSIVDGTLTQDQRLSWLYAMKQEKERADEEAQLMLLAKTSDVLALHEEGKSFLEISKIVELTIPEVMRIVKENQSQPE